MATRSLAWISINRPISINDYGVKSIYQNQRYDNPWRMLHIHHHFFLHNARPNPIRDFFHENRMRGTQNSVFLAMYKIVYPLRNSSNRKTVRIISNVFCNWNICNHMVDNLAADTCPRYRYRWQFGYDQCLNRYRKLTKPMEDGERPGLLSITEKKIIFLRSKLSTFDPADKYVSLFPPDTSFQRSFFEVHGLNFLSSIVHV